MKKLLLSLLALIVVAPAWGDNVAAPSSGIAIEVKSEKAEEVSALVAKLKKAPVYKAAACNIANKLAADVMIACDKADGRLVTFLDKNAPASVKWSISGNIDRPCPGTPGCQIMRCPPPNGPNMCCYTTPPYNPC